MIEKRAKKSPRPNLGGGGGWWGSMDGTSSFYNAGSVVGTLKLLLMQKNLFEIFALICKREQKFWGLEHEPLTDFSLLSFQLLPLYVMISSCRPWKRSLRSCTCPRTWRARPSWRRGRRRQNSSPVSPALPWKQTLASEPL